MFPAQDRYCRLKTSQPMPTVHLLTNLHTVPKQISKVSYFGCLPCNQLTPVSCRQQVGWVSLLLLRVLPHMFSQPLPQVHWLCCEKLGGRRRLAGREQPLQIQIHTHTRYPHTRTHTVSLFFICSCFTLQSCETHTDCMPGI